MTEALPPEILARIFVSSRPTKRAQHMAPFELTLCCVSQWWRAVATSTPELWDTIEIYRPRSWERVPMYLERSGSWPLCLQVDIYDYETRRGGEFPEKSLAMLSELLSSQHSRWRSISILTYCERSLHSIIQVLSLKSAPVLERLQLRTDIGVPPPLQVLYQDSRLFAGGAPNLTKAHIETIGAWPPMRRLTSLRLQRSRADPMPNPSLVLNALSDAPDLVHLSIHDYLTPRDWPAVLSPSVPLNNLELLSLVGDGISSSNFLLSIAAPKLRSIWIDTRLAGDLGVFITSPQAANPNAPKFPSLQYLTLQRIHLTRVSKYSSAFPNITTLHIAYSLSWNGRRVFHPRPGAPRISECWPALHTLALHTRNDELENDAPIQVWPMFVKARQKAGRPLQRILADVDCLAALKTLPEFQDTSLVKLEELSKDTYKEPGWVMREEGTEWF